MAITDNTPTPDKWEHMFNQSYLTLVGAGTGRDSQWVCLQGLEKIVPQLPAGDRLSEPQKVQLMGCLEYACILPGEDDDHAGLRQRLARGITQALDPWRQDENDSNLKRKIRIVALAIRSRDETVFNDLLALPGAPALSEMLALGWMHVEPDSPRMSVAGLMPPAPPALPANTGPLPTSVRWLALMAARTDRATIKTEELSPAEKLLVNPQGVDEPLIGDNHLLEFALKPSLVETLVKNGADPTARCTSGMSRLEQAIRRPESAPDTIMGLVHMTLPGGALSHLPQAQRIEMAEALVEVFVDRFPSQGIEWPRAVAQLCGDVAQAQCRSGERMVDKIAKHLAKARQIDVNPLQVIEQLGMDPATAGAGVIENVPSWAVWEWLVFRYPGGGQQEDPNRGLFCRAAGLEWSPAMMLPLVGSGLAEWGDQCRFVHHAMDFDPDAAMIAAGAFFEGLALKRLESKAALGLNLEFDVGMMLWSVSKSAVMESASPKTLGTLGPWLALFDKPVPSTGSMDPQCVLESCERIQAVVNASAGMGDFLGKPRSEQAAHVEAMRRAAEMMIQTPLKERSAAKPRF